VYGLVLLTFKLVGVVGEQLPKCIYR